MNFVYNTIIHNKFEFIGMTIQITNDLIFAEMTVNLGTWWMFPWWCRIESLKTLEGQTGHLVKKDNAIEAN